MSAVLMTPVKEGRQGNPWKFSPCSINAFKDYLRGVTCTRSKNVLPAPPDGQRSGELLSKDSQCRLAQRDARSSFCQSMQELNGGMSRVCGGMYCKVPDKENTCQSTLPQEFTSCDTNKWCVAGRCVSKNEDSATSNATTAKSRQQTPRKSSSPTFIPIVTTDSGITEAT
ncbi:unnamed protein product, partial [Candidula unifasciata]